MKITDQFDFKSDLLYKSLTKDDLSLINSVQEKLKFSKGNNIFYEGGVPTGMFQIISGRAKKYKTVLNNQQQIFYIYGKNDLLGYHALLSKERYQDSCEALDDLYLNFISVDNFEMLLNKIPVLKDEFLINMAHEFGVLANSIAVLAQKSQDTRLALFLLILQKRFELKGELTKGVNLSREDMANIVGTSRESLSRSINNLKRKQLITVDKRWISVDDEKIEEFISSETSK